MELKTDGNCYRFLILETIMSTIVKWDDFPDINEVKKYLKTHPFPEDKLYSEDDFLEEIEASDLFVLLEVEKKKTTDFIVDMLCELI